MEPVALLTRRLVLRPFRRRDVEPLTAAVRASLPELRPWLPWAHLGYGRDDAAAFVRDSQRAWREGRAFDYAIRSREGPDTGHLGNVAIWYLSRSFRAGEIGYWVRSDTAGRGVATEAAARLVQLGFEDMGLHRVVLRIAVGNTASVRVAEKLGFTREGVLREELKVGGVWLDHEVWSLLDHEYGLLRDRYVGFVAAS